MGLLWFRITTLYDSHFMNHTLLKMQIRKIAPAVIFIFMTMFTLKMFAFNRLDVKRELTLHFTNQNLSDLFEARDSRATSWLPRSCGL